MLRPSRRETDCGFQRDGGRRSQESGEMDYGTPVAGSPVDPGVHVYVGTTRTGKTHLAIQHAFPLARALGVGLLIIDCRGASNFTSLPVVTNAEAQKVVFDRRGVAHVIPRSKEDFEELMAALDRRGNAVVIVDECATYATSPGLALLIRVWRHRRLSFFFTTQKVGGDIEQSVLACDPVLYLFRVTNPRSLKYAWDEHRIDRERLKALGLGEHFRLQG